ncbi:CLUMA_CG014383, isoform A [Clunio marinus]|uniref:Endosome-associated-trafficking regulator 1 n=1 Tax=Clunio marinus TaxID=568069 RepID=A0A1J1IMG2_9DIPT|nr:CLUMA_CG014383, isoform A [Clunio marinus]
MANEKKTQDELNANDVSDGDEIPNLVKKASTSENSDFRPPTEVPKENPFSFKHFLRRDPTTSNSINHSQSNTNIVNNGNDVMTTNQHQSSSQSPSKSATTSSLNSTGARPKIPQFQSVSVIHNQPDPKMKRSPKFSSFDSQSSLSELADERNMHGSRSNNSFNMEYQFPSSRSYSNYDIEPSDRKQHGVRPFAQRSQSNVNSSNSILPDFVQDHLLMEYYNDNSTSNMCDEGYNSRNCDSINHMQDMHNGRDTLDLTFNRSPNTRRRVNHATIPLDLPSSLDRPHRSGSSELHLPPDLMDNANLSDVAVQREETYGPHNEPEITRDQAAIDKMQTLPDFLSDGPIHSSGRLADVATISHEEDNQSIIVRLQQENERLRMELDESRHIIVDMENEISHAKNLETQYNVTLAESMEQVEENLFASNQRAIEAQAQANKYKQQEKQLTIEVLQLRQENEALREGGAVGGVGASSNNNSQSRNLARDLRMAAASAENNLRQLLSGVENLRLIANSMDQPSSSNLDYLSDSDENEFNEGPAL